MTCSHYRVVEQIHNLDYLLHRARIEVGRALRKGRVQLAPFHKGQRVGVIGCGSSATEESLFLLKFVERVTLRSHIHIPSDIRGTVSPEYALWFWICL